MSRFDELTAGMAHILMYSTRVCPYCIRAEQLLAKKGIAADQIEKSGWTITRNSARK